MAIELFQNVLTPKGTLTSDATNPSDGDTFTLGRTTYTFKSTLSSVTRANATLTSNGTAPDDGDTITIDGVDYTFATALTEAFATATLTSDATAPSDGDTVTIGSTVYTFKDTLSTGPDVPFEVLVGISAAAALDNLKLAINAGSGEGTNYATGTTAHPDVEATTNTNTTQVVQALAVGTAGNEIAVEESSSHLDWGTEVVSLSGGVEPATNEVLIGASAATALDNLKSAVNDSGTEGTDYSTNITAHLTVTATTNTNTTQLLESILPGNGGNMTPVSVSSDNLAWDNGTSHFTLAGATDPTPNEIKIAGTAALTLDNVKSAVNLTGTIGTDYSFGTAINELATATTNADTTQLFTAKRTGVFNNITFSEDSSHLSVDGDGKLTNSYTQGASTVNADFKLPEGTKGANFILNIIAKTGTLTHDVKVQYRSTGGTYVDVPGASFAQKSASGDSQLSIYPGLTASANAAVTQILTKNLRVVSLVGGSSTPTSTFRVSVQPVV